MSAMPAAAPQTGSHRPLIEWLGARWALGAPVVGAAWDGAVAGFGLRDGTIALASPHWEDGPRLVPRDGGGTELHPAKTPPPPVIRAMAHRGACLAIAADHAGGFLSGGDDGRLVLTTADGEARELLLIRDARIDHVAAVPGARACAAGHRIHRLGATLATLDLPGSATALGFAPRGGDLAIGHKAGATIWTADGPVRRLKRRGLPRAVAWSPDGAYLVCGLEENALQGWRLADGGEISMPGYPGQPRSLSFAADGRYLATSGAARVACWRFDPPGVSDHPSECGVPSTVPVTRVACHPRRAVIAAGYHNGAVLLCQPGSDDLLFLRATGGGAVSALAWSADGEALAIGTEGGELGLIAFPPEFFRAAQVSR